MQEMEALKESIQYNIDGIESEPMEENGADFLVEVETPHIDYGL